MERDIGAAEQFDMDIAIVGMAGKFPDADDIEAFWSNVRNGVESVKALSDESLRANGVPSAMIDDPLYVKAGIPLPGFDRFDAAFFGFAPREAELIDPQQRLLMECVWHALEHAGYDVDRMSSAVGLYAGTGPNLYLLTHLAPRFELGASAGIAEWLSLMNGNSGNSLTGQIAYRLNLRGPALTVNAACSTSLAAVHLASQALLSEECDIALAGGAWINLLQGMGYRYQEGAILSRDGHCRAFDARASGTLLGSGAGVVVLKRLRDALHDRDTVHAVIRGSAMNNDGATKVGYTAPSVGGQAQVIRTAQALAGVPPETIGYVETHGTGTVLGDPIEIAGLSEAFGTGLRAASCAIGSVKTNIGHLDAAAGIAGLIKTVMALKHGELPPSLNFETPNPRMNLDGTPFYVNTSAVPWPADRLPRRAGVSSFGIGGTNVHVVLEQAPAVAAVAAPSGMRPAWLPLSARTETALMNQRRDLAAFMLRADAPSLVDIAYTLREGRKRFACRAVTLARDHAEAAAGLRDEPSFRTVSGRVLSESPTVAFMFPGQGAQYVGMGRHLYEREKAFRHVVDECCERLEPWLSLDLRTLLYPAADHAEQAARRLGQTDITQPALFVVEYATARLWMDWGLRPDAMLGHSIGEYAAACIAGVFTLEDALAIVALRGRALQQSPAAGMLAVNLPEADLRPRLVDGCELAAVNAPGQCVVAGPTQAIASLSRTLGRAGVVVHELAVARAFHSSLLDPVLPEFERRLREFELSPPRIPFLSNLTGTWITQEQACDPAYWVRHARGTVRFADCLRTLMSKPDRFLVEAGPGETLANLARRAEQVDALARVGHSLPGPAKAGQHSDCIDQCVARLWVNGVDMAGSGYFSGQDGRRVPLPAYPFERQSYWVEPVRSTAASTEAPAQPRSAGQYLYAPTWRSARNLPAPSREAASIVILGDDGTLATELHARLTALGAAVAHVHAGEHSMASDASTYRVRPLDSGQYRQVLADIAARQGAITHFFHLWSLDQAAAQADVPQTAFYSLVSLARAIEADTACLAQGGARLTVITDRLANVSGAESISVDKATLHGACKVIPLEIPALTCRLLDIGVFQASAAHGIVDRVIAESQAGDGAQTVALRGANRWISDYQPVAGGEPTGAPARLREGGVYVITGGSGGIGRVLARRLLTRWRAKVVVLSRRPADEAERLVMEDLKGVVAQASALTAIQVDVTDAAAVARALDDVVRRFGAIHGVIHAAGVPGGGSLRSRPHADMERVFAPKIAGTRNLIAALAGRRPDFLVLCSALTAVTGAYGQADYCAANCYLDACAAAGDAGFPVLSINWDAWRGVGMAADQALPEGVGIAPEDGADALELVLTGDHSRVVVSTLPLDAQFARVQGMDLAAVLPRHEAISRPAHGRPALDTVFVAPSTDLEIALEALWTELLGISGIGSNDSLFDLGGDSLLAVQLLVRTRDLFGVSLHPAEFFRSPCIAGLAELVEARLIDDIESQGMPATLPSSDPS